MSKTVRLFKAAIAYVRTVPAQVVMGVLIGLVCVLLVALDGLWLWSSRTAQLDQARLGAVNGVERVAQHAESVFDVADNVLLDAAEHMQDNPDAAGLQRLTTSLAARVAAFPSLYELAVANESGLRIASSRGDAAPGADSQLKALVAYHRYHEGNAPYVAGVRQSLRDGRLVVSVSRRYDHADGSFAGVIEAVVDVDTFAAFYRRLEIGAYGAVSLWRDDGTLLVRRPPVADLAAHQLRAIDFSQSPAFRNRNGVLITSGKLDAEPRIYAYQHLDRSPLIMFYGVSRRDALAEWWVTVLIHTVIGTLLLNVIAVLCWRVLGQVQRTRRAEGAYRLLADHCSDVIFTLDLQCRYDYLTPSVMDMFGYRPEALVGTAVTQAVHPDDHLAVQAMYEAVAAGLDRALVLHRQYHVDGHSLWIEVELRLVRSAATGAPVSIIGAARDVTARQAAEATLQAEQSFFQAVFEFTADCLFVQSLQPDGSFVTERINPAAACPSAWPRGMPLAWPQWRCSVVTMAR